MEIKIRKAIFQDCERMMELIRELAVFERAPNAVSVTLEHLLKPDLEKTLYGMRW